MDSKDKLELGCGDRPTEGFIHQDISKLDGVDLDFTCNPWEIELAEGSLSLVLASGMMEHLRFDEFKKTVDHMALLLRPGGSFCFDVPDMKIWSEYLYNITHGMKDKNPFPPYHVWATIYGWQRWPGDEHKSGWTRNSLLPLLKEAGFSKIEEGVEIFKSMGLHRRRFDRPADAHVYIKAVRD